MNFPSWKGCDGGPVTYGQFDYRYFHKIERILQGAVVKSEQYRACGNDGAYDHDKSNPFAGKFFLSVSEGIFFHMIIIAVYPPLVKGERGGGRLRRM